jgi:hypothetical protein
MPVSNVSGTHRVSATAVAGRTGGDDMSMMSQDHADGQAVMVSADGAWRDASLTRRSLGYLPEAGRALVRGGRLIRCEGGSQRIPGAIEQTSFSAAQMRSFLRPGTLPAARRGGR